MSKKLLRQPARHVKHVDLPAIHGVCNDPVCAGAKFFPAFVNDRRRLALDDAALQWQAEGKQRLKALDRISITQDQAALLPKHAAGEVGEIHPSCSVRVQTHPPFLQHPCWRTVCLDAPGLHQCFCYFQYGQFNSVLGPNCCWQPCCSAV